MTGVDYDSGFFPPQRANGPVLRGEPMVPVTRAEFDALKAQMARLEKRIADASRSGFAWAGYMVHGDEASVAEVRRLALKPGQVVDVEPGCFLAAEAVTNTAKNGAEAMKSLAHKWETSAKLAGLDTASGANYMAFAKELRDAAFDFLASQSCPAPRGGAFGDG